MEKAQISFSSPNPSKSIYDCGDGMVEIIWWREKKFNLEMISKKPIWEILKSKDMFNFTLGETIEIPLLTLKRYFIQINPGKTL
jgi:hypothetical protein